MSFVVIIFETCWFLMKDFVHVYECTWTYIPIVFTYILETFTISYRVLPPSRTSKCPRVHCQILSKLVGKYKLGWRPLWPVHLVSNWLKGVVQFIGFAETSRYIYNIKLIQKGHHCKIIQISGFFFLWSVWQLKFPQVSDYWLLIS